jgi:L,D-peptidoglycan transpeptidase YkuD (ErfK/YbiS/YcfS/YnhG family)
MTISIFADEQEENTVATTEESGTTEVVNQPVLKLERSTFEIYKGKTESLKLTKENLSDSVKWSSSNKKVATVNQSGKVTAKSKGTAVITAKAGNLTATCTIKVSTNRWNYLLDKYQYDSKVNQLVFVKYKGKKKADVLLYTKTNNQWKKEISTAGYVGKKGINKKREGDKKTPTGTFNFTGAFGIKSDPGAKMKYTHVTKKLYWCGDKKYYNQLIDITKHPHKCVGEHLINYKPHYNYGMFLDFNKSNKYKKGSAIFLHCKGKNNYTAGCIAISESSMKKIIQTVENGSKICIYNK